MSDRVIIVGATRGHEKVSAFELAQMLGRSGRTQRGKPCMADIIVGEEDSELLSRPDAFKVTSHLTEADSLAFHILPEIGLGRVADTVLAEQWYSRSLGAAQGNKPNFLKILKYLEQISAVQRDGSSGGYSITEMGKLSVSFYFRPAIVNGWAKNFGEIFRMGLETDDLAIAWALGGVSQSVSGYFGDNNFLAEECKNRMPRNLSIEDGHLVSTVLWWSAIGGPPAGKMRGQMLQLRFDFSRINNVLRGLNKLKHWEKAQFFEDLAVRVQKGIPSHLIELCQHGLSKSKADGAYNIGIRTIADLEAYVGDDFE